MGFEPMGYLSMVKENQSSASDSKEYEAAEIISTMMTTGIL